MDIKDSFIAVAPNLQSMVVIFGGDSSHKRGHGLFLSFYFSVPHFLTTFFWQLENVDYLPSKFLFIDFAFAKHLQQVP